MTVSPARRDRRQATYDGVSDSAIYARDGWTCRMPECLCPDGRAIDRELDGRDDPCSWAPSIDHRVPVALGGRDDAPNKRAAHRRCNQAAAERLGSTLGRVRKRSPRAGRVRPPAPEPGPAVVLDLSIAARIPVEIRAMLTGEGT
jgi:hypothetical protein